MYKKFHPEHFVCAFCLKQLNKGTFKEQNDKPYCQPCFTKLFGWDVLSSNNSWYANMTCKIQSRWFDDCKLYY